jgi:ferrous iron transport protein A
MRTVADLKKGEFATIASITEGDGEVSLKLLEMGCLPGCRVRVSQRATGGCPLCLEVDSARLTIRRETAAQIQLL